MRIPNDLIGIVDEKRIYKYCTKPELEILIIINERLINEFNKSKLKPSTFLKKKINYSKSNKFIISYYKNVNVLIDNIKEYKRIKTKHYKDELYLADLLKK